MSAEENGLTLEQLAQRLEGLQRENAQRLETQAQRLEALERENDALRHKVATLEGSGTRRDELPVLRGSEVRRDGEAASAFEGQVSRRSLLSKAGAAAVAAVAAGTLLNPREARAAHYGPGIEVDYVNAHSDNGTAVYAVSGPRGNFGVVGYTYSGAAGVRGGSAQGIGVVGYGNTGVKGSGENGVHGESTEYGWAGVYGNNTADYGFGVVGDGTGGSGAGVLGRNPSGTGVRGEGRGQGVEGRASIEHGVGVLGLGGTRGYGGAFQGGKANLLLQPGSAEGPPTTGHHAQGALYMDSAARLFVCTEFGTPGTWRRFQTAAT